MSQHDLSVRLNNLKTRFKQTKNNLNATSISKTNKNNSQTTTTLMSDVLNIKKNMYLIKNDLVPCHDYFSKYGSFHLLTTKNKKIRILDSSPILLTEELDKPIEIIPPTSNRIQNEIRKRNTSFNKKIFLNQPTDDNSAYNNFLNVSGLNTSSTKKTNYQAYQLLKLANVDRNDISTTIGKTNTQIIINTNDTMSNIFTNIPQTTQKSIIKKKSTLRLDTNHDPSLDLLQYKQDSSNKTLIDLRNKFKLSITQNKTNSRKTINNINTQINNITENHEKPKSTKKITKNYKKASTYLENCQLEGIDNQNINTLELNKRLSPCLKYTNNLISHNLCLEQAPINKNSIPFKKQTLLSFNINTINDDKLNRNTNTLNIINASPSKVTKLNKSSIILNVSNQEESISKKKDSISNISKVISKYKRKYFNLKNKIEEEHQKRLKNSIFDKDMLKELIKDKELNSLTKLKEKYEKDIKLAKLDIMFNNSLDKKKYTTVKFNLENPIKKPNRSFTKKFKSFHLKALNKEKFNTEDRLFEAVNNFYYTSATKDFVHIQNHI